KAPMWTASGFVTHLSFDELDKYAGEAKVEGVFTPGQSAGWDNTITLNDFTVDTLRYWGWIAGSGNLGQFGYQVNGGSAIYNDAWTHEEDMIAHAPAGSDHARRMQIWISLAGLEGENSIRVLYKNAEGAEACLSEFTVTLPEKPKDIENTFASDVASNEVGTNVQNTDLKNYFSFGFPTGTNCLVQEGGIYFIDNINEMYADVNGKVAFTTSILSGTSSNGAMFIRGYHAVHSADLTEAKDGMYVVNNYYETDSNGYHGGAGIFSTLADGNLYVLVKQYTDDTVVHVANKIFAIPGVTGTNLTLADDGNTVYVLVDGVLYATVALSGETTYEKITLPQNPDATFAQTAVVTLADGTTETIENTMVASTLNAQIGIAVRGGTMKFNSVKVEGFSAVEIPEFETPDVPPVVTESIPMESWTVTGHAAGLTSKDKEGIGGMVAAGGLNVGALLHQGSVGLGELDLSKYSKVIIKYGIDNGPTTIEKHTANGTNRIMLTTADNNMTMTPGGDVLAYVDYTPNGWSLMSIEIDLTAVDYNGNVFLTWDTLDGTFMLIGSVEFVCVETPEA
ncbi:MAG: hypothetical protein J6K29_00790, partial [Clostridia bacterium]|nr:hypothetical protein [Clostridia bacterium]